MKSSQKIISKCLKEASQYSQDASHKAGW